MRKVATAVTSLLSFSLPAAFADIREIDEAAIVKAIGAPVLKRVAEEDSPGCNTTRYTFGDKVFDMKLEFKCNRINVAWTSSKEPKNQARSEKALELASRAVQALTQESGVEVAKVSAGQVLKERTYTNGLVGSGSCAMTSCLLTFK